MDESSVREELSAIRALMTDSQRLIRGTWSHQLVWGVLVSVGLALTWAAEQSERYPLIAAVWLGVVVTGWTFSIWWGRTHDAQASVHNTATRAFAGIWVGLGITLTMIGMLTIPTGAVAPDGLPGVLAAILGAGYFASGVLAGMRWLLLVAVAWWLGAAALLVWQGPGTLLGLAALTVAFEVLPALALRRAEAGE